VKNSVAFVSTVGGWVVGAIVGDFVVVVGVLVVGIRVGCLVVGTIVMVGDFVVVSCVGGLVVGIRVGVFVVGSGVGDLVVGTIVGDFVVGSCVGDLVVGIRVGCLVVGIGVGLLVSARIAVLSGTCQEWPWNLILLLSLHEKRKVSSLGGHSLWGTHKESSLSELIEPHKHLSLFLFYFVQWSKKRYVS
jgi:hypothetical protein